MNTFLVLFLSTLLCRADHVSEGERVKFDVICGDFNIDNLSPCDKLAGQNRLFSEYSDHAAVTTPGEDQAWAVGTEMRQLTLNTPEMQNIEEFREILMDDVRRRHYIIDADVRTQTMELMSCPPSPDQEGKIKAERHGGMRRIDRILLRRDTATLTGYAFVSALAGATDHVPVVASLSTGS